MDFNNKEHVEKLFDHLYRTSEQITCGFCDKSFIDPVGLRCSHRFCSKCVREHKKKNDQCPTCKKPVLNREIIPMQTNVKMFQASFTKLLKALEKKYLKDSARLRALKDFMINRKPFTQVKRQYETSDVHEGEDQSSDFDQVIKSTEKSVIEQKAHDYARDGSPELEGILDLFDDSDSSLTSFSKM